MGGLSNNAAIETADVVIQTDQPSKIAMAIKIGNAFNKIIWQNIGVALGVKILVLLLGALSMTTM
jgi:Cd2+/Zn2+-exporting ATPase